MINAPGTMKRHIGSISGEDWMLLCEPATVGRAVDTVLAIARMNSIKDIDVHIGNKQAIVLEVSRMMMERCEQQAVELIRDFRDTKQAADANIMFTFTEPTRVLNVEMCVTLKKYEAAPPYIKLYGISVKVKK